MTSCVRHFRYDGHLVAREVDGYIRMEDTAGRVLPLAQYVSRYSSGALIGASRVTVMTGPHAGIWLDRSPAASALSGYGASVFYARDGRQPTVQEAIAHLLTEAPDVFLVLPGVDVVTIGAAKAREGRANV